MTRRAFLAASATAALAEPGPKVPVCVFSKHLHFVRGQALAEAAASIGFDGVDLTVRKDGHVEPERTALDLPDLVKTIRQNGLLVPMVTAGITDAASPHAESIIRTLSSLDIRYYRWGGFRYDPAGPLAPQLDALKHRIAELAALNKRYGVCAIYHTHSGLHQVGASIWDLHILLKEFDPASVAVNYDVAHATIEGGYGGWINSLRVCGPYLRGVAVKDFLWAKTAKGEWRPQWKPIGEGMVDFPQFFRLIRQAGFAGPLQIHYEYPLGGADSGARTISIPREQVFAAMKRDLALVRRWLS